MSESGTQLPHDEWRETVRDIYDEMHFGLDNVFTGSKLAQSVVALIEARHPGFFVPLPEKKTP
jgi:hypothetical protein